MTESRHDPFRNFRESARKARVNHIENALRLLKDATFKNVTRLAINVANLVTDAEAASRSADAVDREGKQAPMSHITLLKNTHYREILESYFNFSSGKLVENTVDLELHRALQVKCGSLESQIKLLKQMVVNQDSKEGLEYSLDPIRSPSKGEQALQDAKYLLDFLDDFRDSFEDMVEVVLPGEESGRPAGIHGPFNQIRTHEEMEHLQSIRDRIEHGMRESR